MGPELAAGVELAIVDALGLIGHSHVVQEVRAHADSGLVASQLWKNWKLKALISKDRRIGNTTLIYVFLTSASSSAAAALSVEAVVAVFVVLLAAGVCRAVALVTVERPVGAVLHGQAEIVALGRGGRGTADLENTTLALPDGATGQVWNEIYVVQKRWSADSEFLKLWEVRSGL